jgi:hypothetical protein
MRGRIGRRDAFDARSVMRSRESRRQLHGRSSTYADRCDTTRIPQCRSRFTPMPRSPTGVGSPRRTQRPARRSKQSTCSYGTCIARSRSNDAKRRRLVVARRHNTRQSEPRTSVRRPQDPYRFVSSRSSSIGLGDRSRNREDSSTRLALQERRCLAGGPGKPRQSDCGFVCGRFPDFALPECG